MTQYALVDATHTDFLLPGKNVIGRGSVELEGVSFVEIYSPNSSVSRVQANIEICPNGDAWICDCNSTNGTFLSVNDGPGICLAPKHYYQLTPGCRVVFGDVERVFKRITPTENRSTPTPSPSSARAGRNGKDAESARAGVGRRSSDDTNRLTRGVSRTETKTVGSTPGRPSGSGTSKNVKGDTYNTPYLADEETENTASEASGNNNHSHNSNTNRNTNLSSSNSNNNNNPKRKTSRSSGGEESVSSSRVSAGAITTGRTTTTTSPAKRTRVETDRHTDRLSPEKNDSVDLLVSPVVACLSGMDADEREEAKKVIRAFGRVVDDIMKANVLVVRLPAVRTPKFIIAVGRGIPIVAIETFKNSDPPIMRSALMHDIVFLKHEKNEYTSSLLRTSINAHVERPCLTGRSFSIQALPHKNRDVAKDIIQGCGGKLVRGKATAGAQELTEDSLQELYDLILRAKE